MKVDLSPQKAAAALNKHGKVCSTDAIAFFSASLRGIVTTMCLFSREGKVALTARSCCSPEEAPQGIQHGFPLLSLNQVLTSLHGNLTTVCFVLK